MSRTCHECQAPLQRVPVTEHGAPLSVDELMYLAEAETSKDITHECEICGALCYQSSRSDDPPYVCKRCGGYCLIRKPKDVMGPYLVANILAQYSKQWVCPVHGRL